MKIFEAETIVNKDEIDVEDSGCAIILKVDSSNDFDDEHGMFVRIQSWDERSELDVYRGDHWDKRMVLNPLASNRHKKFQEIIGKKIKVTIEIVD